MKKILSAMTALILILSVLCAGALAEAADITGKWYASLFGISVTMSLNEDGSYVLQMDMEDEEPSEGTWEFDGAALVMDKGSDTEMTPKPSASVRNRTALSSCSRVKCP